MQFRHFLLAVTLMSHSALQAAAINAIIDDNGDTTFDNNTQLEWLDVTLTRGLSVNEVQQRIDNGGMAIDGTTSLTGWRFATGAEFDQLIQHFGIAASGSSCPNGGDYCLSGLSGDNALIETIIDTLGDTGDAAVDASNDMFDASATGTGLTSGFLKDSDGSKRWHAKILDWEMVHREYGVLIEDYDDEVVTHDWSYDPATSFPNTGAFLVRTSAVPLPGAAWLFLSGLFGLAARRRISKA
jgi:hypothetical protein